jgi:hypothetical protein
VSVHGSLRWTGACVKDGWAIRIGLDGSDVCSLNRANMMAHLVEDIDLVGYSAANVDDHHRAAFDTGHQCMRGTARIARNGKGIAFSGRAIEHLCGGAADGEFSRSVRHLNSSPRHPEKPWRQSDSARPAPALVA